MTAMPVAGSGRATPPGPLISIAVFAYNESERITACLDSIAANDGPYQVYVHVLINGCTDNTPAIVAEYARHHTNVRPVMIRLGDKANAWNHYVHDVAPDAAFHCFIDGDMQITPGSLDALTRCFASNADTRAMAALPAGGRSQASFRDKLVRNREMAGNFYALRGGVITQFRAEGVRLPIGLFGEDGMVTALVKWDLDPRGIYDELRVSPCEGAGFAFPSLSPFRPSDWRIYRNRKMRYAVRRQQAEVLYPLLFERGITAMPNHVVDMYRAHGAALHFQWNGWNTIFDYLAIRRIRKKMSEDGSVAKADEARYYS